MFPADCPLVEGADAQAVLWEPDNLVTAAACCQRRRSGGRPVAGRLWTVQHEVARLNLLYVL